MTLLTPWGLLGLLAIPVILGLHFFRQQRRMRQVGGLHLWDFARLATPTGRRFEKLRSSMPLLFQLLAALLLTLLLAGFDIPTKKSARHYCIILDDSISMQARVTGSTAAKRAVDAIEKWANGNDRFTLILAGPRPIVSAGPAATLNEMKSALGLWSPNSSVANFEEAINIAAKFGDEKSRIILVTDNPTPATYLKDTVTLWGVGRSAPNDAIIFADRFEASDTSDRIVATVQGFGGNARNAKLSAYAGGKLLVSKDISLETSKPVSIQLDVPRVNAPLRLALDKEDSLAADNAAILQPSRIKPVSLYVPNTMPQRDSFVKAEDAVKQVVYADNPDEANLVISDNPADARSARRSYIFYGAQTTDALRMAVGRDLVVASGSRITQGLSLDGVIWPFDNSISADARTALRSDISYTSIPLLYPDRSTSTTRQYHVNLSLQITNIFRHTAWPVLVMNMIEECRDALPGLPRTNLRAGEEVRLNLEPDPKIPQTFSLWRQGDAKPAQTWQDYLPDSLQGLPVGTYSIRQGDDSEAPVMGTFRINLFSQGESDLGPLTELKPDLKSLEINDLQGTDRNFLLFYALLAGLVACVVLGWVYHDAGH